MEPIVCMITEPVAPDRFEYVLARVAAAARAGVHIVQIRQRTLSGGPLLTLVRRCMTVLAGTHTRLVVNDRLDVALAAGGDGVHLRADSAAAPRVRRIAPPGFLIGRSVHTVGQAAAAAAGGGVDYLVFGTTFSTPSKPGKAGAGVEALAEVVAATPLPVLAVGGMTVDRLATVARTGAAGFAAIRLFTGDGNAPAVLSEARKLWKSAGGPEGTHPFRIAGPEA
jgi:thiamine-phosphate diphosphorylase